MNTALAISVIINLALALFLVNSKLRQPRIRRFTRISTGIGPTRRWCTETQYEGSQVSELKAEQMLRAGIFSEGWS